MSEKAPTPETDALRFPPNTGTVEGIEFLLNHGRKLERERDKWWNIAKEKAGVAGDLLSENRKLKKERDEARRECENWRSYVRLHVENPPTGKFWKFPWERKEEKGA